ncbi:MULTISPECIES: ATP-grasp domain-containing protein [Dickeya]|uniref:ATP-grasp domain-containing protein n=1 Tax=Dickeya aquatica TaxID=1401087 RepID=A0A375A9S1_9GAMM|nr:MULTISPECIES: ATP-grasp domain-containing protein [Dickeya]SLM62737.1 hypothetical protein DAQ1742_01800 [Dickeya aquatica]
MPKYCVVVDGFGSGQYIAPKLIELGYHCIHITALQGDMPFASYKIDSTQYDVELVYNGDIDNVVVALKPYDIIAVLPGIDSGVALADQLADKLTLKQNNPATSRDRLDKYHSHLKLKENNLPHASGKLVSSEEDLIGWFDGQDAQSIIVKPPKSTGGINVYECKSHSQLVEAFHKVQSQSRVIGISNDGVLAQELLKGVEYIVDSVSFAGKHYITDIWRSDKLDVKDGNYVYEKTTLLPAQGDIQDKLVAYHKLVLDALGLTFGPCHNEIMLTEKGPVLIEMNPRPAGGNIPDITQACTGKGQIGWIDSLCHFLESGVAPKDELYTLHKIGMIVPFISHVSGKLTSFKNIDKVKSLNSFYKLHLFKEIGSNINVTKDMFTIPGAANLVHEESEVINKEYYFIRDLEHEGLFDVC